VTILKDDVHLDGSGQLRTLIESLTKHYDRSAQAITPVQQNTGEVFAIVRKRLFEPADRIDEVAQASRPKMFTQKERWASSVSDHTRPSPLTPLGAGYNPGR
jgi:hypothetical protein